MISFTNDKLYKVELLQKEEDRVKIYLTSHGGGCATVKPPNKEHIGDSPLSLVERLSFSWRFSFKPTGKSLKTNTNT